MGKEFYRATNYSLVLEMGWRCGNQAVWACVTCAVLIVWAVLFGVGVTLITDCATAQDNCKNDLACSVNYEDGCFASDSLGVRACDLTAGDTVTCKWVKACECSKTRAGIALVAV